MQDLPAVHGSQQFRCERPVPYVVQAETVEGVRHAGIADPFGGGSGLPSLDALDVGS
ncbi:hypothetical protein [Paenarthrobacter aromaticivorans]|uniref:Uncharacterized protein n=1 Tax=Paenarthrobacter aromaticivorans TaxID=2849150 RepID=A0ABS6I7Z8_9MICC|nr:hypothetical protein [Paenarthrobacter sp. MMS21-TAE1-1]MBU8867845.1 hypothetical protein [Paenarthrobacter sp. MMS21-TAE1-1]